MLSWRAHASHLVLLLTVGAMIVAVPAAASADELMHGTDAARDPAAAQTLETEQAEALATLPMETSTGACARTGPVDGLGDACRTRGGLFRVVLDSGETVSTHGADAPPDPHASAAAAPHVPESQAALEEAGPGDIECVTAQSDRRIELVYAYPADRLNRIASITEPMRQAAYEASAFIDAESRSIDPAAGRRLRVLCSGGVPVVQAVQVPAVGAGGASFSAAVDGLVAAGFPAPTANSSSPRRVLAYYDAQHSGGAAGTGDLYHDDRAGSSNYNNKGSRYAIEWDWSTSRLPHWDVLLHEASHNMGAVADAAPDASGNGHCNDGLDIMCYRDGGATSNYSRTTCTSERYDCGADTYFNPRPVSGSWLATHWNLASTANAWIQPRFAGWVDGGIPDVTAPTVPADVTLSGTTTGSITATWTASTDDRSTVRYRVFVDRLVSGAWVLDATIGPMSATTATAAGLVAATAYRVRIVALDEAGNTSAESAPVSGSTSAPAPPPPPPPPAPQPAAATIEPPSVVNVARADATSIAASWTAAVANTPVAGYELALQRGAGAWTPLGTTAAFNSRVGGLDRGATWHVRVRTVTITGAVSAWRVSGEVATPAVTLTGVGEVAAAPERPQVAVPARTVTSATVSWNASVGATSWSAQVIDQRGVVVRTFPPASARSIVVTGLRPNTGYTAHVVAYAGSAVAGSTPGSAAFTTARDNKAPSVVRLRGVPRLAGATVRVVWRPAIDNVAVARYEIQRKVGVRWVRIARVVGATRAATIKGLRARSVSQLRIRAIDTAGLPGRWTTFAVRRR